MALPIAYMSIQEIEGAADQDFATGAAIIVGGVIIEPDGSNPTGSTTIIAHFQYGASLAQIREAIQAAFSAEFPNTTLVLLGVKTR